MNIISDLYKAYLCDPLFGVLFAFFLELLWTKIIRDFGKSTKIAPYTIHFAAHYADADHAVTETTSGYRLALVYSLCWFNGNGISMLNSDVGLGKAMEILKNNGNIIGVLLKHRYTPRSFQQNARATLSSCI